LEARLNKAVLNLFVIYIQVGFIYIFNLIVGTGALTMPKAFENSGVILSTILLIFLTLMSFITATFMFESMSIANAIKKFQKQQVI